MVQKAVFELVQSFWWFTIQSEVVFVERCFSTEGLLVVVHVIKKYLHVFFADLINWATVYRLLTSYPMSGLGKHLFSLFVLDEVSLDNWICLVNFIKVFFENGHFGLKDGCSGFE